MDTNNESPQGAFAQAAGYAKYTDEQRMDFIVSHGLAVDFVNQGCSLRLCKPTPASLRITREMVDAAMKHNHSLPDATVAYQSPAHENRQNETK